MKDKITFTVAALIGLALLATIAVFPESTLVKAQDESARRRGGG